MTCVSCMVLVTLATTRPSDAKAMVPRAIRKKSRPEIAKVIYVENETGEEKLDDHRGHGEHEIRDDAGGQHVTGRLRE